MKNVEDLKLKRITLVIPFTKHSLFPNNSFGAKKNRRIDKKNEKKVKNEKKIQLKDLGPFKYIKGSEIASKIMDKRWWFSNWKTYGGRWRLKDFFDVKWELRETSPLNGFYMATAELSDETLTDLFGSQPFNGSYQNRKFNQFVKNISNFKTKHSKSFGIPIVFLETESFKYNELKVGPGFNKVVDVKDNFVALRKYYNGNDPYYVIPYNDEKDSGFKFWMSSAYYNNPVVQRLFVNNILYEMKSGNDHSDLDEIVLKRFIGYLKKRVIQEKRNKIFSIKNPNFKYNENSRIKITSLGDITESSTFDYDSKSRALEYLEDQLLQKEMTEKKKQNRYNGVILVSAISATLLSVITVLISIIK